MSRLLSCKWQIGDVDHELRLVHVEGTNGIPYRFGGGSQLPVEISDFYIATTQTTQELWTRVMGSNPSRRVVPRHPVDNVSWNDITGEGGFLERINASEIRSTLVGSNEELRFRLPSETEWEYAARGGPHWKDGFAFSGSNDIDKVAWYGQRFSEWRRTVCRVLGWKLGWRLTGRQSRRKTQPHEVAARAPNQLGIFDMSGNVWEWCQDVCVDLSEVPLDGTARESGGEERRLRGGCHHNWDLHCTVWWRYGIEPGAADDCIGFRLVLSS